MPRFQRPRTISEGVYDHLRAELFAGRLQPGQWLREQELAEALEVSRTPVREAVRRLAQEGFLVLVANRGAQVRPVTLAEAIDVYEVRVRLECMAAGLAARCAGAADVARLRLHLERMDGLASDGFVDQIRADNALHLEVAQISGNEVLSELVLRLSERVTLVKVITRDANASALTQRQHRAIVDAIARHDEAGAERAMDDHIRTNLELIRERLAIHPPLGGAADRPELDRPGRR